MMERLLRRKSTTVAISVFLAVCLWLYVTYLQNPSDNRSFHDVPIDVLNVEGDVDVVQVDPPTATVTVMGPRRVLETMTRQQLSVFIDLSGAVPGTVVMPIQAITPQGVQVGEIRPAQTVVQIEPVQRVTLPIELVITGQPAPEYRALEPQILPQEIEVRGAASVVAQVERVVASIDISGEQATVEQAVQLFALTATGQQVQGVRLEPLQALVTVPIEPRPPLASLPIRPVITGAPAQGYVVSGPVQVRPDSAVVRGPDEVLAMLDAIPTEEIDIGGATETVQVAVPLALPDELELVNPQHVTVLVPIHPADEANGS